MNPNQPRRDSCKVCKGRLPARKSRYCSRYCERRARGWRKRPSRYLRFLRSVVAPVPVSSARGAQASARALIRAGVVLAYERDGLVLAVGKPGPSEHLPAQATERRERLRAARAAEAEDLREAERKAQRLRGDKP